MKTKRLITLRWKIIWSTNVSHYISNRISCVCVCTLSNRPFLSFSAEAEESTMKEPYCFCSLFRHQANFSFRRLDSGILSPKREQLSEIDGREEYDDALFGCCCWKPKVDSTTRQNKTRKEFCRFLILKVFLLLSQRTNPKKVYVTSSNKVLPKLLVCRQAELGFNGRDENRVTAT